MSEPFLLIGLQFSILLGIGLVLLAYMVLALVTLMWSGAEFVALHMRKFARLAQNKPLAKPVLPLAAAAPMPAIRRRIAYK